MSSVSILISSSAVVSESVAVVEVSSGSRVSGVIEISVSIIGSSVGDGAQEIIERITRKAGANFFIGAQL
jgi:hypothetical protein